MKSDIHRPCQDNCLHDPFFFKSLGYVLLCNPIDCIVHGILQARVLEWVTFPFSRGSSQPRDSRSPTLQADSLPAEPSTMWGSLRTPRFKEKSCCPLGEDPALLQRLMSFIFSLLDCRELIWKANNATLSEGRYIGNRCSNSAWVHGPLRWIIPWLTSLPEALPPNWWLVETESPQRKGGGPQPAEQGSEETASGSSGSRQRLSGEAGLGHRRVVGCRSCWRRAPGLSPGFSAWWMGAGWQAHCAAVTWDCARPGSGSGAHRKQEIGWAKRFQYFRTRMRSSLPNWLETL